MKKVICKGCKEELELSEENFYKQNGCKTGQLRKCEVKNVSGV